jgi:hypothetical protein
MANNYQRWSIKDSGTVSQADRSSSRTTAHLILMHIHSPSSQKAGSSLVDTEPDINNSKAIGLVFNTTKQKH